MPVTIDAILLPRTVNCGAVVLDGRQRTVLFRRAGGGSADSSAYADVVAWELGFSQPLGLARRITGNLGVQCSAFRPALWREMNFERLHGHDSTTPVQNLELKWLSATGGNVHACSRNDTDMDGQQWGRAEKSFFDFLGNWTQEQPPNKHDRFH